MTAVDRPGHWHALRNGILLLQETDPATGEQVFHQLQTARPITPDDLQRYDAQTADDANPSWTRWAVVLGVGFKLFLLLLLLVPVGLVLAQFDATETVGGYLFWFGLPLAVLTYVVVKVSGWRIRKGLTEVQHDAGLVPGMVDQIEPARGQELIEAHGVAFTSPRLLRAT